MVDPDEQWRQKRDLDRKWEQFERNRGGSSGNLGHDYSDLDVEGIELTSRKFLIMGCIGFAIVFFFWWALHEIAFIHVPIVLDSPHVRIDLSYLIFPSIAFVTFPLVQRFFAPVAWGIAVLMVIIAIVMIWGSHSYDPGVLVIPSGNNSFFLANGLFLRPISVAADNLGNFYVSDSSNWIQKFDERGNLLAGRKDLKAPQGLFIDKADRVYVAEHGGDIMILNSDLSTSRTITPLITSNDGEQIQSFKPTWIALDSQGLIYVTDQDNKKVIKMDQDGRTIKSWFTAKDINDTFVPRGIAIDNSNFIYVVDNDNDRIIKFDSEGRFIDEWGQTQRTEGRYSGQPLLKNPEDVAIDDQGNLYVTDTAYDRIFKFTPEGVEIGQYGNERIKAKFNNPVGIDINDQGKIFVANFYQNEIQVFSR